MIKFKKVKRQPKRYECKKCGRMTAVKHEKDRFRCLECNSYFGPNSKKGCYTKKEYLVLKTLLQLFNFMHKDDKKNYTLLLKEFVKLTEEQPTDNIKKLVEVNVINKVDDKEKLKMLQTKVEDIVVITRDKNNRFRVYKNFFKANKQYVFDKRTINIENNGRYTVENMYSELWNKLTKKT